MVGRTLDGRYTILAKLGAGSMGTVYRARQHAMGREVAIKILRGDRADDDSAKARFMREAHANSLLASPNTVTVFDFGQSSEGEFYLAMELLEGENLGQRLARVGRMSAPLAVDACRQALRSLGEAHAKGIIHRDLKPDNLFFSRVLTSSTESKDGGDDTREHDELVKVVDFGIAKMIDSDSQDPMSVIETQAGTVFGTPRYMSPEQARGLPLDARSDLYSLAVILYQMLTGRPPFTDNDAVVVMARHIKSTPIHPSEAAPDANVPSPLGDLVMRTLCKDPRGRPSSAEAFASELLSALEASRAQISGVHASLGTSATADVGGAGARSSLSALVGKAKTKPRAVALGLALTVVAAASSAAYQSRLGRTQGPSRDSMRSPDAATKARREPETASKPLRSVTAAVRTEPPSFTPESLPSAIQSTAPNATLSSSDLVTRPSAKATATAPGGHTTKLGTTSRSEPEVTGGPPVETPAESTAPKSPSINGYGIFD